MESFHLSTSLLFIACTIYSVIILYISSKKSKLTLTLLFSWMLIQAILSLTDFYKSLSGLPVLPIIAFPGVLFLLFQFNSERGKQFIDSLCQKKLIWVYVVRIPVEIVLYLIFLERFIPKLMTFEGVNFDILAGVTAPIIFFLFYIKKILSEKTVFIWNILSLALLVNIIINSVLSSPGPLQVQAFDQPNIGMFYFPLVWLPSVVVPIVLLGHLSAIRNYVKTCNVR